MDPPISEASSGVKRPLSPEMSSNTTKRAKLELPPEQLTIINDGMILVSNVFNPSFEKVADDQANLKMLSSYILAHLVQLLSTTSAKASTFQPLTAQQAQGVIDGFNDHELDEWKAGLQKGFQDNDWSGLIAHPKLHVATTKTKSLLLGVPIEHQHAVMKAWKEKYLGGSAQSLEDAIDEINKQEVQRNYAKIIAIIQSSGTGKSKTVDQIAKKRVLFPLCLREEIGNNYFAYPPVDAAVRNHLLAAPSAGEELTCKQYLREFLASLFKQALIQAQLFIGNRNLTYEALAGMFYNLFSDPPQREDFYKKVVKNATSVDKRSFLLAVRSLKDALLLCKRPRQDNCLLHIGLDEVHLLFQQRKEDVGSNHTLFSRLKSVLSEVVEEPLCTVFLSTAGTVSELAPAQDVAPSIRERDDERILPAPFTELPFDVDLISEPLLPGNVKLTSVGSIEFTARFGRPLFFSSYKSHKSQGEDDAVIASNMMNIIREKLCGFRWPPNEPAKVGPSIAVLSARLLLDLSPASSETRRYEEDQVRSHLRLLYSVQRDKHVIVTGSSPEPLIAEASAEVMHYRLENDIPYMNIWKLLSEFIDDGVIALGTIGELIGRVLSILAMDRAINSLPPGEHRQLKYQTPVSVAAYYKALLTNEAWESLRLSVPANGGQLKKSDAETTFEAAFQNAYIHFSHYAKANDDTPMKDQYSWALWLRGTAILCQLNQNLTDRAIPIHFPLVGDVGPNSMSVILDQDKAGQSVDAAFVSVQSAEKLQVFSRKNDLPYIDGVHCYALMKKQGIVATKKPGRPYRNPSLEAPRYRFEVSGLASYKDIAEDRADIIRAMIDGTKNGLFIHHPRKDALPLLRMMQPMLNGTPDATAWFGGFPVDTA